MTAGCYALVVITKLLSKRVCHSQIFHSAKAFADFVSIQSQETSMWYRKCESGEIAREFINYVEFFMDGTCLEVRRQLHHEFEPIPYSSLPLTPRMRLYSGEIDQEPSVIYTDGCSRKMEGKQRGFYGFAFKDKDFNNPIEEEEVKSLRSELFSIKEAIDEAIRANLKVLQIHTDCFNAMMYLDWFALEYEQNVWKFSEVRDVENADLMKYILDKSEIIWIRFIWIPEKRNKRADKLSRKGSMQFNPTINGRNKKRELDIIQNVYTDKNMIKTSGNKSIKVRKESGIVRNDVRVVGDKKVISDENKSLGCDIPKVEAASINHHVVDDLDDIRSISNRNKDDIYGSIVHSSADGIISNKY